MTQSNQDKFPRCQWREWKHIKYVTPEDIMSVHGTEFFHRHETLSCGDTRSFTEDNKPMIYYCDYLNHRSEILYNRSLFWD